MLFQQSLDYGWSRNALLIGVLNKLKTAALVQPQRVVVKLLNVLILDNREAFLSLNR